VLWGPGTPLVIAGLCTYFYELYEKVRRLTLVSNGLVFADGRPGFGPSSSFTGLSITVQPTERDSWPLSLLQRATLLLLGKRIRQRRLRWKQPAGCMRSFRNARKGKGDIDISNQ